jgi:hypothetical protein
MIATRGRYEDFPFKSSEDYDPSVVLLMPR